MGSAAPRRILLLITDLEIGGTPTVVRELAIRLNRPPDVVVEVACLKGWGPVAEQIRDAGVNVTALNAHGVSSLPGTMHSLRDVLRSRAIDTVVSFLVHANTVAALALRPLKDIRLIQSIQTTQQRPRWHWWAQRLVSGRADRFVVPSRAIVRAAVARSAIAEDRFVVIPNAIDPADYPRTEVFAGDAIRVGFLGRIDPVKRLDVAVEAIARIDDIPVELHVFGPGRHTPKKVGGSAMVYHGAVSRPLDALSQMDVLVLPSIGEGFGLVLIEAMAAGVPVIASAAGAIPEVVRNGETGLLVPVGPREVADIARGIRRLRSDPAFRERIITNALADVRERYTWNVVLPQYEKLLRLDQS